MSLVASVEATTIHTPADYPTIQASIDAAQPGDTVLVAPGTYTESLDFGGKGITVSSVEGPLSTVITNSPTIDLVVFDEGEGNDAVLEGFTLDGGHIAVWCQNSAPTLRRLLCKNQNVNNWAAVVLSGIGWASWGPSPAFLENLTIVDCVNGGISTFSTVAPTITNTIVANCKYGIHHQGNGGSATPIVSYNNMWDCWLANYYNVPDTGAGTISADPLFAGDFQLTPLSPCIDAGDPNPIHNDPDGSRNDMGAVFFGTRPGAGDTVFVESSTFSAGDTVVIRVGLINQETHVGALAIPLSFASQGLQLIAVQHIDLAIEFDVQTDLVDSAAQTVLLGYVDFDSLPAGQSGYLTELTFTAPVDALDEVITITSTMIPPANTLLLVDPNSNATIPTFLPGTITIESCPVEVSGDVQEDGIVNAVDIIYVVNYVFRSGPEPLPVVAAGDVNCDGSVTTADIIALVGLVFKGGAVCNVCTVL